MIDKFFILSTGRNGTLSLTCSLRKCGMNIHHEHFRRARILSNKRWDNQISDEEIQKILHERFSKKKKRGFYIDSNCLFWNIIDLLENQFKKNVGYIYVHRDSKETIDSMFRTDFCKVGKKGGDWNIRAKTGFRSMLNEDYDEIDRYYNCAYAYKIRTEAIINNLQKVDPSRVLEMPFEKMVKETNLDEIVSFITRLSGREFTSVPLLHKHRSRKRKVIEFDISTVLGKNFKRTLW